MDRFFGRGKPEPKKQQETIPTKKTEFNMGKRTAEIDSKCDQLETKLKTLETDIKCYYDKLKRTNLKSEKNYLKGRIKNLLMRRKQIEHQLSNYNGQRMRMDRVQFAQQNIQDTLEMANHMDTGLRFNLHFLFVFFRIYMLGVMNTSLVKLTGSLSAELTR